MNGKKVALVTGGSRGIGKAIALRLAQDGFHVALTYVQGANSAMEVSAEIARLGGSASIHQFNVADPEAIENGVAQVLEQCGRIDVLVNNAGITADGLSMRVKPEDWDRVIDTNLSGAFFCAKAVMRPMMKERAGRIINISSVIGQMGNAGQASYAAAKAGMIGLTKSLARELGSRNITVNAVAPGYIETDMTNQLNAEVKNTIKQGIVLERLGSVEDIAAAVSFLAGPGSSYITGQVLAVNGGLYM
ncbi:3-oxoacyl-[acyl-carrier-protein] reductase [bacterium]|nr:3-oxoacyl-[acyl-carrier-protein] reductase [bacterium]